MLARMPNDDYVWVCGGYRNSIIIEISWFEQHVEMEPLEEHELGYLSCMIRLKY